MTAWIRPAVDQWFGLMGGISSVHTPSLATFKATVYRRTTGHNYTHTMSLCDNMTMCSLYSNGCHSHEIEIQFSTFGTWCVEAEIWIKDLLLTNLQQLRDAVTSIWKSLGNFSKISFKVCSDRPRAVLKAKTVSSESVVHERVSEMRETNGQFLFFCW